MKILIAFPKIENGIQIKRILQQRGYEVYATCSTGARVLAYAQELSGGIVICGYRLTDMVYSELRDDLPPQFEMLLFASSELCENGERQGVVCLKMPLKVHELIQTVDMMSMSLHRKQKHSKKQSGRTKEEQNLLCAAKGLLMERNHMTEEEAHRYLQRRSMENGTKMLETAQMVLSLMR